MPDGQSNVKAVFERADVLLGLNRPAEALTLLESAAGTWSQEPNLYTRLSLALLRCGRISESLVAAERALALNSNSEWAHRLRSAALENLRRIEEAEQEARAAIRLAPLSWYTYERLAALLGNQPGRMKEAEAAAQKSLELAPEQSGPHIRLARLAIKNARWAQAESSLRAALRIDPHELDALQLLGQAQSKQAKLEEALDSYQTLLRTDPSRHAARQGMATLVWRSVLNIPILQLFIVGLLLLFTSIDIRIVSGTVGLFLLYALPIGTGRRYRRIPGFLKSMLQRHRSLLITGLITLLPTVILIRWWLGLLLSRSESSYLLQWAGAIAFANLMAILLCEWYSKDEQKLKSSSDVSTTPITVWFHTLLLGLLAALLPLGLLTILSPWSQQWWFVPLAMLVSISQISVGGRIDFAQVPIQLLFSRWRSSPLWLLPPLLIYVALLLCGSVVPLWATVAIIWPVSADLFRVFLMVSVVISLLTVIVFLGYFFVNLRATRRSQD